MSGWEKDLSHSSNKESEMTRTEELDFLQTAFSMLDEDKRELIELVTFQKVKYTRLTELLGTSKSAVKTRAYVRAFFYVRPMTEEQQRLWEKIRDFEIDDPHSDFKFSDRLARENGWSLGYSLRTIFEYKKFMFLIIVTGEPMTPSDQVDQVWHLHLIYTRSYWEDFCQNILGTKIHHGPTKGGNQEKLKYRELYEGTKKKYLELFEKEPPADIWPSTENRFGNLIFERINKHTHWKVRKPRFWIKWKT